MTKRYLSLIVLLLFAGCSHLGTIPRDAVEEEEIMEAAGSQLYYSGISGGSTYTQINKYEDTGGSMADKSQANFEYIPALGFYYLTDATNSLSTTALWPAGYTAGFDESDETNTAYKMPNFTLPLHLWAREMSTPDGKPLAQAVATLADLPTPSEDGQIAVVTNTSKVYFSNTGAFFEVGTGSVSGVSSIKGEDGALWLTGQVELKAGTGVSIDSTPTLPGQITITSNDITSATAGGTTISSGALNFKDGGGIGWTANSSTNQITATNSGVTAVMIKNGTPFVGGVTLTAGSGATIAEHVATRTITLSGVSSAGTGIGISGAQISNTWGKLFTENVYAVDFGNINEPGKVYFGSQTLGAWALEFPDAVSTTVKYNWTVPVFADITKPMTLTMNAFIDDTPASLSVVMKLHCNRFASQLSTTQSVASWTETPSNADPYEYTGGAYTYLNDIDIVIPANTFNKEDDVNFAIQRDGGDGSDDWLNKEMYIPHVSIKGLIGGNP